MTKAAAQKAQAHKHGYRTATEVALAALICAGLRGCCFVGWEYISIGRWWATLMRHDLFARPPLTLAPGMCMTAFAAVLVALASSTLGASSGLARTIGAAIALTPVAVAADGYSATAAGAQKEPGRRLSGWHGCTCPCVKPTLDSHPCFVKYYACNVALQWGLGARQCVYLQVTGTVAPASYTGKAICNAKSIAVPSPCADSLPPSQSKARSPRAQSVFHGLGPSFNSKEVQRSRRGQRVNPSGRLPTPGLNGY